MAITRCPYCHAIIDEADKYCNNCGTQLLFSEDEEVEEEIPGEKIIDADVEEKDYTVDEPEEEKKLRPAPAKDLEAEIDEALEGEIPAGAGKTAIDELMAGKGLEDEEPPDEVILVDDLKPAEAAAEPEEEDEIEEPLGDDEDLEDEKEEDEEEFEEDLEDEIEEEPVKTAEATGAPAPEEGPALEAAKVQESPPHAADEPEIEYVTDGEAAQEAATAGEASLRPVTFDSQELENLGRTVELSREKIDQFIEVMAGQKAETGPVPLEPKAQPEPEPTREPEPEPETEAVKAVPPEPPTGTLPPWASTMKGAPVFLEDAGPVERIPDSEEVEIFPRRRDSDSTIGLPEKISQAPLPFAVREEAEPEEQVLEGEEPEEEESAEPPDSSDLTPQEGVLEAAPVRPAREPLLTARAAEIGASGRVDTGALAEAEGPEPSRPFSFSVFFRSKLFDLLFVGLFWLVALWLAASSMGTTLFDVLNSVSGSMLLLYAVFVLLYFFLFKFFLGETLGDRLFRPRE